MTFERIVQVIQDKKSKGLPVSHETIARKLGIGSATVYRVCRDAGYKLSELVGPAQK
jgi:DNA-binding MurR/RpiR family transcriptional regulator